MKKKSQFNSLFNRVYPFYNWARDSIPYSFLKGFSIFMGPCLFMDIPVQWNTVHLLAVD